MDYKVTPIPHRLAGESAAALPGPQMRGTGGTLIVVRDRGHLPTCPVLRRISVYSLAIFAVPALAWRRRTRNISRGMQASDR